MASPLDETTVRHIAHLARLAISDTELSQYAGQLAQVLAYMERLKELDTSDVLPLDHPAISADALREDQVVPSLSTEHALRNAPDRQGTLFRVPRVLEQDDT